MYVIILINNNYKQQDGCQVKKQFLLGENLVIFSFLFLFVTLSFIVKMQLFSSLDLEIFTIIQEYKVSKIHDFFLFITKFSASSSAIIVLGFISIFLYSTKRYQELVFTLIFFISSAGGAYLLKYMFAVSRPVSGIDGLSGYSYPSGHSVLALCLTLIMYRIVYLSVKSKLIFNIYATFLVIYATLSISARVILGAHWCSDALGSILFVLFVYHFTLNKMTKLPIYEKLVKMVENEK